MSSYLACAVVGDRRNDVVEIGIIEQNWADRSSLVRFHTYLRPPKSIDLSHQTLRRWGIRRSHLSNAPQLDDVYDLLCERLEGPVYGYHIERQRDALVSAAKRQNVAPDDLTDLRWRELSDGASRHRAVQGRTPSLRRVCVSLDIGTGGVGEPIEADLAGTVHRANVCRRLHEKLLNAFSAFDSTFREVGTSPAVPDDLERRVGPDEETSPPGKMHSESVRTAIETVGAGDLVGFVGEKHPLTEAGSVQNGSDPWAPAPGDTSPDNTSPGNTSPGNSRPSGSGEPHHVFLGVNTVTVESQKSSGDGHIVVSLGLVSEEGETLLDTTVRPRTGVLFGPGDDALYDKTKTRFVKTSDTGLVTPDDIWVAPPFRRIAGRLLRQAKHHQVWAFPVEAVKTALVETARAAENNDLASDLESMDWAGLRAWMEKRPGSELSLPEADKNRTLPLTDVAASFGLHPDEKGKTALSRARLLREIRLQVARQERQLIDPSRGTDAR